MSELGRQLGPTETRRVMAMDLALRFHHEKWLSSKNETPASEEQVLKTAEAIDKFLFKGETNG